MEHEFARRFAEAWSRPSPERLVELLHPDVVLYQPHLPTIRGKAAALEEFRRLFHWLPGLHGEVDRSCGFNGVVFIEWRMKFPIGSGISIGAVDRFLLKDGLGLERAVYFDQAPLFASTITHPRALAGFLKYRLGRR
jgi:SnoaL-like domain